MWKLDNKKGWVLKNWCLWTVVLEKTLESPLESKEIKPINHKGNQPWIFTGLMLKRKRQYFGYLMQRRLIGKDPDAGKDWGQEEKGTKEDEMVGQYHQLNGLELEQTPGDGKGKRSLACCSPWGGKESDATEKLNNGNNMMRGHCKEARSLSECDFRWHVLWTCKCLCHQLLGTRHWPVSFEEVLARPGCNMKQQETPPSGLLLLFLVL